MIDILIADSSK